MGRTKGIILAALVVALAAIVTAAASASAARPWYANGHPGHLVCDHSATTAVAGPFATKALCEAFVAAADPPPSEAPPAGWPGTTGTLDGDTSGPCVSPVVLTSGEGAPGFGAFNFDVAPDTEFQNLGLTFDFDVLSGSQAQSEPYIIVRFTDGTQVFVYSVDVNPGEPGDQVYSITGNTYLTRSQALEQVGSKIVSSATLAVDNGDLSIQVNGVTADGCDTGENGGGGSTAAAVSVGAEEWLCYSMFQRTPGAWPGTEADGLIAQGYWEAEAVPGNVDGGANVGAYHMTCNAVAQGFHFTGTFLGDGGDVFGADYGPASKHEVLGFYDIFA